MEVRPGRPYPLGATYDGAGTNFSLFSESAEAVDLCLFDEQGREERVQLPEHDVFCWHGYLPGIVPGQRYGFRVHGPWDPERGLICNDAKLLMDPYGKAVEGGVHWDESCFPYRWGAHGAKNELDSAPHVPRSIVINPWFDWDSDRPPRIPMHETVIYEVHVKGFTMRHPAIPEEIRGSYAGLAHPAAIEHMKRLGVTTIELLPVHQFVHDHHLHKKGLRNYWGYNSIGFLAPHNEYSASGDRGQQVQEFKTMVRDLHAAGLEVILDVVYNHTAEGNDLGPVLSFKGIDNRAYYRLVPDNPRHYYDTTGTGNSLNMRHPHSLQLIMDSLRYWVLDMHVDGFRFDLAAALARELHDVDMLSSFFSIIQQDPVISQVKLIAEPWDLGEGGYQVGNFPALWSEWNGRYRDTMRDFWRGEPHAVQEFAARFTGSGDLYEGDTRRPSASINFVTAHDGFTLLDLVSYQQKHNQTNGEDNRDGGDDNRSWNCGVEGPTDDPTVRALRDRQARNFLVTLFLSQGVPMLLGGDEIGRTQRGNNNAYGQDNEVSWFNWASADEELMEFTRQLIEFRREHPVFRRRRWFQGRPLRGTEDIAWLRPDGEEMTDEDWTTGELLSLGVFLNGEAIPTPDERGQRIVDDSFLVLLNARESAIEWQVSNGRFGRDWRVVIDTGNETAIDRRGAEVGSDRPLSVEARTVVVLQREGRG